MIRSFSEASDMRIKGPKKSIVFLKPQFYSYFLIAIFAGCSSSTLSSTPTIQSSASLWAEYVANPNTHSHIPNNSYAGCLYGEKEGGECSENTIRIIFPHAARYADGIRDATAAIQKAISDIELKGGGVLYLPPGKYRIKGRIVLGRSRVVLSGSGPESTVLLFENSLTDLEKRPAGLDSSTSPYSWSGGLIHVGPKEDFPSRWGKNGEAFPGWRAGKILSKIKEPARTGQFSLALENASEISAGQWVFLAYENESNNLFLNQLAGFADDRDFPWATMGKSFRGRKLPWPVQVLDVKNDTITLKQPLRFDVRGGGSFSIRKFDFFVEGVGVENLRIVMPRHPLKKHNQEAGFNGIFIHRAVHSWVKNVVIENADNGILLLSTKNVSVSGVSLVGTGRFHHGIFSKDTHDCLVTGFSLDALMVHGINSDKFGSGNVWRRGKMRHGTFDMHHGMQFDLIRTDIEIENDGENGGQVQDGPMQGKRVVHWNIRGRKRAAYVYQAGLMPMGALVGIQGLEPLVEEPDSNNGHLIADHGRAPNPADLYEAQRKLRISNEVKVGRP